MALTTHQVLLLLLQVSGLLLMALCLGWLARRVGLPAVVGELATGILLGPSVFGQLAPGPAAWLLPARADQSDLLAGVAQLAVLLMVGIAGAHVDTRMIRRRGGVVASVSLGGLVVPLALGVAAGCLMPAALLGDHTDRVTFAAFLGVALSVSAIPIIAKTLSDMKLLHRDVGQLTLAAASIEDALAWMLLSLVSAMAVDDLGAGRLGLSTVCVVSFVVVAAVIGRPLVHLAMRATTRSAEPGPAVATAVVLILAGAAGSQALGLEPVFGAFVVGVLLASAPATCRERLAPLRTVTLSVLAPIFLAAAGLHVDLRELRDPLVLVAGITLLLLATLGKFAGAYAGARLTGLGHWEGMAIGAGLNARGVVEIVVASVGLKLGVLTAATYTIVVLVAVLTSVMAPPLLRWSMKSVEHRAEERLREVQLASWTVPHHTDPAYPGGRLRHTEIAQDR